MFYVREKISDTAGITVEIHDDNVFYTCPGCGSEVCVDLSALFSDGKCDLYATSVCCPACSMKRLEGNR